MRGMMQPYGYGYGGPPSAQYREVQLLAEWGVQVTSSRFIVGMHTYPIAGITSVAPFHIPAERSGAIVGAIIFGLLGIIVGWTAGSVLAFLFFGVIAAIFVVAALLKKSVFGVVIATAGMQHRALVTHDGVHVTRVVNALNQAIAMR